MEHAQLYDEIARELVQLERCTYELDLDETRIAAAGRKNHGMKIGQREVVELIGIEPTTS